MNIFHLIKDNLTKGPQTLRFPERHVPAEAYRGNVSIDADSCRACGMCAKVCVSAAIVFQTAADSDECSWSYDPSRCTFCGLCLAYCPVNCLSQAADRGPSCSRPGEQATTVTVVKRRAKKAVAR